MQLRLGLLETFSEACEVCAGRGVIVHHDPVVRHRATGSAGGNGGGNGNGGSSNRRGRGGNGQGGNGQNSGSGNGASQTGGNGAAAAQAGGTHVITEGVKSALAQIAASTIQPHEEPAAVVAEEPVAERPERPKRPRRKKAEPAKTDADRLLDSVLEALPEPKAPGQGRARRRVTTAALTGTPVQTPTED